MTQLATVSAAIYRAALQRIAAGAGHYGAQAREYKQIAQAALAEADALARTHEREQGKALRGLDCGVSLRTGHWECSCGECPSPLQQLNGGAKVRAVR